ncbi:MAG: hypothetical protein JXR70_06880 [Spirochaetales bacterium]|nr:hypothetical protein [Spirochaetales bacterium]
MPRFFWSRDKLITKLTGRKFMASGLFIVLGFLIMIVMAILVWNKQSHDVIDRKAEEDQLL